MDAEEFDAFYAATARRLVGQLTAMTGDVAEALCPGGAHHGVASALEFGGFEQP